MAQKQNTQPPKGTRDFLPREVRQRELVLGKVRGNVTASDRVDIRAEGSLSGDVSAARISIEDGAFFKGGIDIRKPETKPAAVPAPEAAKVAQ